MFANIYLNEVEQYIKHKLKIKYSSKDFLIVIPFYRYWASLVAQMVKNLPAMQDTRVRSLGWEEPLQEEMATHPSILAWRILRTEEPGGL